MIDDLSDNRICDNSVSYSHESSNSIMSLGYPDLNRLATTDVNNYTVLY